MKEPLDKQKIVTKSFLLCLILGFIVSPFLNVALIEGEILPRAWGHDPEFIFFWVAGAIIFGILGIRLGNIKYQELKSSDDKRLEEARLKAELDEDRRRIQRDNELIKVANKDQETIFNIIDDLPAILQEVLVSIKKSEEEFKDGAFSPFWDQIEIAANGMARYQIELDRLNQTVLNYAKMLSESENIPPLTFNDQMIPDARELSYRLKEVVRNAQKDFQFSTIFEQRKTNTLLYEGFGTLASSLNEMGARLESCVKDLTVTISTNLDHVVEVSKKQLATTSSLESTMIKNSNNIQNLAKSTETLKYLKITEIIKP